MLVNLKGKFRLKMLNLKILIQKCKILTWET